MKTHIWRPFFAALALIGLILLLRLAFVPDDFGVHERGYMYGWYRKGNEAEWQAHPIKYKTDTYCKECHPRKIEELAKSLHSGIMCENCHGPALGHPDDPPTLTIDRSRSLCARCHSYLPYRSSARGQIRGIDIKTHYPEAECVLCHYPHTPQPHRQRRQR